jgi:subtilase family serine protease
VAPQRIVTAIDATQTAELPDNVPAQTRRAVDLGAAPGDGQMTELSLDFGMTTAQQAALTQLMVDQQNPASARYHQWLTPEQFAAQFGLAPADLQKISNWLSAQGFTVTEVARGGMFLRFKGTVAQVQSAFHTQIHRLSLDGETHIANLTPPELPVAVATVTNAIGGLHDFPLKPHYRAHSLPAADVPANPAYTSAASGNHFIAPGDFYTIYDENPLLTGGINGTGVTIGVVGQTDINLSDIATFRSVSGLPGNPVNVPIIKLFGTDPGTSTTDLLEAELDVEWSGATAPNAQIIYYNSTNAISGSLRQAIQDNQASIITVSYGLCESSEGLSNLNTYNLLTQQANAQGQTVISAAGDAGATDCDYQVASATLGLAADFPAVLPGVTAIGGTMYNEGSGTYWSSTNGTTMGSALSYVPETAWNEDSTGVLSSGGGGVSAYITKPVWQVGTGVPADASRDVPDISFNAASSHDGYLICTPGYCVSGYKNASALHDVVGGTSVGAPAFAGLMALVVQKTGGRVGNANPTIYALANSSYYSSVFHDITSGTNASPCTTGTVNCPGGGSIGYNAGVGYDLATGWGSLDVFNFVNDFNLVTPLISTIGVTTSKTTLSASSTSVLQGGTITMTATVASGTTSNTSTPTGTVQFLIDNVAFGTPVALVTGTVAGTATAAYTLNTAALSGGAHTVAAAYLGDATFAGSKGSFVIIVLGPDFTLTPATSSASVKSGSTVSGIVYTVTGTNNFAGNVTFSVNTPNGSFSTNPVVLSTTTTSGTTTLTITTATALATSTSLAATKPGGVPWYGAGSGVVLAGLLMLVLPKRRRFVGALVAVLSVGMIAVSGCGGGGSASSGGGGSTTAQPGTYAVVITAVGTSGTTTVSHTAALTLTVQ